MTWYQLLFSAAIKSTVPWHIGTILPLEVSATLMASALWCGWPCHPLGLFCQEVLGRLLLSPHCVPADRLPILPVVPRWGTGIYPCHEVSLPWRSPSPARMVSEPTIIALSKGIPQDQLMRQCGHDQEGIITNIRGWCHKMYLSDPMPNFECLKGKDGQWQKEERNNIPQCILVTKALLTN